MWVERFEDMLRQQIHGRCVLRREARNHHQPLRHLVERHHPVGRLLDAVTSPADILLDPLGIKD